MQKSNNLRLLLDVVVIKVLNTSVVQFVLPHMQHATTFACLAHLLSLVALARFFKQEALTLMFDEHHIYNNIRNSIELQVIRISIVCKQAVQINEQHKNNIFLTFKITTLILVTHSQDNTFNYVSLQLPIFRLIGINIGFMPRFHVAMSSKRA